MENHSLTSPYPHPIQGWSEHDFPPIQQHIPFLDPSLEQIHLSYTYPHLQNPDPWELLPLGYEAPGPGYEYGNTVCIPYLLGNETLIHGSADKYRGAFGTTKGDDKRWILRNVRFYRSEGWGGECVRLSIRVRTFTSGIRPPTINAQHSSSNPGDRRPIPGVNLRHTLLFVLLRRFLQLPFPTRESRHNPPVHLFSTTPTPHTSIPTLSSSRTTKTTTTATTTTFPFPYEDISKPATRRQPPPKNNPNNPKRPPPALAQSRRVLQDNPHTPKPHRSREHAARPTAHIDKTEMRAPPAPTVVARRRGFPNQGC